jgi:hypothetical protein
LEEIESFGNKMDTNQKKLHDLLETQVAQATVSLETLNISTKDLKSAIEAMKDE